MNNWSKDHSSLNIAVNYHREFVDIRLLGIVMFLFIAISTNVYGEEKGNPIRGETIFNKRSCSLCHSINGKGGEVGPDLTHVNQRRSEEWLFKWLKDPESIKPDTIMPKMDWDSDQEILDIISYLKSIQK